VQSALQAAFPACNDLSDDPQRGITSFTPHLSLGQWRSKQQVQDALQVSIDTDGRLLRVRGQCTQGEGTKQGRADI
jgi:hypothetical protein